MSAPVPEIDAESDPRRNLSASLRGGLWMVGACLMFTGVSVVVRMLGETLDPFQVVFFRNAFSLMWMMPWVLHTGRSAFRTDHLWRHALRAMTGAVAMTLFFWAMVLMPLAEVNALTFLSPVLATAGAALFLGETVRRRRWIAVGVGFAGAMIVLRPGAEAFDPAALLAVGAAVFAAGTILLLRLLGRTEDTATTVLYLNLFLTPISLLPALWVWQTPTAAQWGLAILLGLFATVVQLCMTRAFTVAEASAVMPFDYSRLVFVAIAGYLLFGEVPEVWTWVGGAIIMGSTVYIAHRESRPARGFGPP